MKMLTSVSSSPATCRRHLVHPLVFYYQERFPFTRCVALYFLSYHSSPALASCWRCRIPLSQKHLNCTQKGGPHLPRNSTQDGRGSCEKKVTGSSELGLNDPFNHSPEPEHADKCELLVLPFAFFLGYVMCGVIIILRITRRHARVDCASL